MAMPRHSMDDQWKINVGCFLRTCRKTRWFQSSTESSQKVALCLLKKMKSKIEIIVSLENFCFWFSHSTLQRTQDTTNNLQIWNVFPEHTNTNIQIQIPNQLTGTDNLTNSDVPGPSGCYAPLQNIVGDDDIDNYPWSNPWGWWQQQPIVKLGQIQRFRITNAGVENRAENTE